MRAQLKNIDGRNRFTGVFVRHGTKPGWKRATLPTILLRQVEDAAGKVVADHLWLNLTAGFQALGELRPGDTISFEARVRLYEKGYRGRRAEQYGEGWAEYDYKLSHPTKIKRLNAVASVEEK